MPKKRVDRERTPYGLRMLKARKRAGLTQQVARERIGCSQSNIVDMESIANGSSFTAQAADVYGVDPRWLATGQGTEPDWSSTGLTPTRRQSSELADLLALLECDPLLKAEAIGYLRALSSRVALGEFQTRKHSNGRS